MRTIEMMDKAMERHGLKSDYALAAALKTSRQVVSRWRNGATPDPLHAVLLADLAGIDRMDAVAFAELEKAEKADKPEVAESWRRVLGKATGAAKEYRDKATGAVITGILIGTILTAPSPVNASSISPAKPAISQDGSVYIM